MEETYTGYLWSTDPKKQPVSFGEYWPNFGNPPKFPWAILDWGDDTELTFRFPRVEVGALTKEQVQRLGLRSGDRVTVTPIASRRNTEETHKVIAIHGIPVENWRSPMTWRLRGNFLRELLPVEPLTKEMALWRILFPFTAGTSTLISGPAGTQKTYFAKELLRSTKTDKVLIISERSSEWKIVSEGTRVWALCTDLAAIDQMELTEYALAAEAAAAAFSKTGTLLVLDSFTKYAEAVNLTVQTEGHARSGGLSHYTIDRLSRVLALARHPRDCGHLTLVGVHMVMDKEAMSESLLRMLRSLVDTYISLQPGSGLCEWFPATLEKGETLVRKIEFAFPSENEGFSPVVRKLFALQMAGREFGEDQWEAIAEASKRMSPEEIWEQWQEIVRVPTAGQEHFRVVESLNDPRRFRSNR